jgi:hypothetical protein
VRGTGAQQEGREKLPDKLPGQLRLSTPIINSSILLQWLCRLLLETVEERARQLSAAARDSSSGPPGGYF